ncbi:type II toxin-antitoxin system VapC family toxin [Candidatus Poribacteria bacterium]|nr:type II toxin-antitoxin system VapC family toxin [Candidatus Poribacteria bacterium]
MPIYFFDSSALAKRYVAEVGSNWVKSICNPNAQNIIACSNLAEVEVSSAFCRRCREGYITTSERDGLIATLHHDCNVEYYLLNVTNTILNRAIDLLKNYPLRGYDAVQLATALVANQILVSNGLPALTFACADNRLCDAAASEGLTVENPINYP